MKYDWQKIFIDYLMSEHKKPISHLLANRETYGIEDITPYVQAKINGWVTKKKNFLDDAEKRLIVRMQEEMIKELKPVREKLREQHKAILSLITVRINQELERSKVKKDNAGNIIGAGFLVDYKCLKELWAMIRVELWLPTGYTRAQNEGIDEVDELDPATERQLDEAQQFRTELMQSAELLYKSGKYIKPKNVENVNGELVYSDTVDDEENEG